MKTLQSIAIFLILVGTSQAQSPQFEQSMKENLEKMAKWSEPPQTLASTFERIAMAEQTQWLPYYYAAYATIIQSFAIKEADLKDKTLDHAQSLLDAALVLRPDSSEYFVMQGFLYIAKLQVDPMTRGAEYSIKANEAYDKAILLNPENPRAYYMKGTTILNTPDFFGGGKAPAKPILTKAVAKFESFKPLTVLSPDWGKQECQKQLAICQ